MDAELLPPGRARRPVRCANETLARASHQQYRDDQKGTRADPDLSMQPWEQLDEGLKESNRRRPTTSRPGCGMLAAGLGQLPGAKPRPFAFTPEEVEVLGELEHERWVSERRLAGWVSGDARMSSRRTPYLVPWADLTDEVKEWDRQTVRGLPAFLAEANLRYIACGDGPLRRCGRRDS